MSEPVFDQRALHADRGVIVYGEERPSLDVDVPFGREVADMRATVTDRDFGVGSEQAVVATFDDQRLKSPAGGQFQRCPQFYRGASVNKPKEAFEPLALVVPDRHRRLVVFSADLMPEKEEMKRRRPGWPWPLDLKR